MPAHAGKRTSIPGTVIDETTDVCKGWPAVAVVSLQPSGGGSSSVALLEVCAHESHRLQRKLAIKGEFHRTKVFACRMALPFQRVPAVPCADRSKDCFGAFL
jgi:hypothetical protein